MPFHLKTTPQGMKSHLNEIILFGRIISQRSHLRVIIILITLWTVEIVITIARTIRTIRSKIGFVNFRAIFLTQTSGKSRLKQATVFLSCVCDPSNSYPGLLAKTIHPILPHMKSGFTSSFNPSIPPSSSIARITIFFETFDWFSAKPNNGKLMVYAAQNCFVSVEVEFQACGDPKASQKLVI